ncbi:MAG: hypothetical protein L0214_15465, partial [candidate division NC10 bacterium]|nr:hypothetical protein [candidate division NC10 bacterium]
MPEPAPNPNPTPTPTPAPDWRAGLPEDVRSAPTIAGLKAGTAAEAVAVMAPMLLSAERMVGAEKVAIPGKEAKPEEWAAFWNRLGRPEKSDGYEIPKEGLKSLKPDQQAEWIKGLHGRLHELGLSRQQAAGVLRFFDEDQALAAAAEEKRVADEKAAGEAALRKTWGESFDE